MRALRRSAGDGLGSSRTPPRRDWEGRTGGKIRRARAIRRYKPGRAVPGRLQPRRAGSLPRPRHGRFLRSCSVEQIASFDNSAACPDNRAVQMIPHNEQAGAAVHGSRMEDAPRWTRASVEALFALPFNDLLHRAQTVHRLHFDANAVQLSTLLSIKTGGCPEDCAYCPQSARYHTGVENEPLLPLEAVLAAARAAKQNGATRFCMGAAWRGPKQKDIEQVAQRVRAVKALGLETCATLGLLREGQAEELKAAGLDYYNHNLDTAPSSTGRSSPRASIAIGSTRLRACAAPESRSVAGGSWAWASRVRSARASSPSSRAWHRSPSRCRSTI